MVASAEYSLIPMQRCPNLSDWSASADLAEPLGDLVKETDGIRCGEIEECGFVRVVAQCSLFPPGRRHHVCPSRGFQSPASTTASCWCCNSVTSTVCWRT